MRLGGQVAPPRTAHAIALVPGRRPGRTARLGGVAAGRGGCPGSWPRPCRAWPIGGRAPALWGLSRPEPL